MTIRARHDKPGLSKHLPIRQELTGPNAEARVNRTDLIAQTMGLWPRLAMAAGLGPVSGLPEPLLVRADDLGARVVLAIEAAGRALILKHDIQEGKAQDDHFALSLLAQKAAGVRLAGNLSGLCVPEILAFLPDERIALMERVAGQPASKLIEQARGRADRRGILASCGRWLGEYHQASFSQARPYRTHFVMDHLRRQRAAIASGQTRVAEPAFYLRLSAHVEQAAAAFDGLQARHAARHGDYNLRNVLVSGSGVAAIDFKPDQTAPIGHDIARVLIDYAALYGEHQQIPEGQVVHGAELKAFLGGHMQGVKTDASVGFLLRAYLLTDWARIPAVESQRNLMQTLRLQGLTETALRLFPALRAA